MTLEALEHYFDEISDPKDLLFPWRKKAWDHFLEIGLPRRKQEAFQYLPLQDLIFPPPSMQKNPIPEVPAPLLCLPLETAMRSYGVFLQNRLVQMLKEETDPFAVLNAALQKEGFFLYVPPKVQLEIPLEIHHLFFSNQMASPRIHLYVGKGSRLQIIRKTSGEGLSNAVFDVVLDESAELSFFDVQALSEKAHHLSAFRAKLKRDSRLYFTSLSEGASLSRTSLKVQLAEENSEAHLRGLSRLGQERQNHIHATVEHQAPNARSRQHFKAVLKDKSTYSFEGKILVRSAAQKTEAYQLSNVLLLSEEARANAKPNLEIFADDVKASHGATVGQLNKEELFYLRSRGLSLEEARQWLIDGFCREILDALPKEVLRG